MVGGELEVAAVVEAVAVAVTDVALVDHDLSGDVQLLLQSREDVGDAAVARILEERNLLDQARVGEALHARSELGRQPREQPALVLEQQRRLAELLEVAAELAAEVGRDAHLLHVPMEGGMWGVRSGVWGVTQSRICSTYVFK